ncbi:2-heptaprenyl-1,4-naphthoquinone methyltransferase [Chondromyces apiculatus DSM 436]|uniref:2-heptaprenyl-1,4-naphthoquinone methyltransferase n=2 Tax=Chondromyces apiculatus TaxID=51 RepID=A0A017T2H0_9BACT|nr:2-heptaprenyl-1,4-naphthoquinone methyltransferase [Chondromyces apiculatus DSM 436]
MAVSYERWAEPLTVHFAREALGLAGCRAGERVLDVAAGTGALAVAAAEAGALVLATDFSPGMVGRLKERLAGFGGCEARVMDGQALEVEDGRFDASFSMFGVMMFPDFERGLSELVRATRGGGQVVVGAWVGQEGAGPSPLLGQALRKVFPETPPSPPTPGGMAVLGTAAGMEAALRKAGCTEVVVHAVESTWGGASVEGVMGDVEEMLGVMPQFAGLDGEGQGRVKGAFRELIAPYVGEDGAVRLPVQANVGVGRKAG